MRKKMKKTEAIQRVKDYISKKEFNWDAMYHIDEEPVESVQYWIFKNLWEPRDPMRGDAIYVDWQFPYILVDKQTANVFELSQDDTSNHDLKPVVAQNISKVLNYIRRYFSA